MSSNTPIVPSCYYNEKKITVILPAATQPSSLRLPSFSIPSSQRCPTYPLPYLSIFYSSILILYLPISKLSAYNSYLSLLLCPILPQSLPSYFSVLVILPKLQCPPLFSPYDNFKSKKKNSAQKPNYSLEQ